jgi:hypothetical protein
MNKIKRKPKEKKSDQEYLKIFFELYYLKKDYRLDCCLEIRTPIKTEGKKREKKSKPKT